MLGDVAGEALDFDAVKAADQNQVPACANRGRMALGHDRYGHAHLLGHRDGKEIDVQDRVLGRMALNFARQHMQHALARDRHLDRAAASLVQRDPEELTVHGHCDRFLALTIHDAGHAPRLAIHDCYGGQSRGAWPQCWCSPCGLVLLDKCNTLFYLKGEL